MCRYHPYRNVGMEKWERADPPIYINDCSLKAPLGVSFIIYANI